MFSRLMTALVLLAATSHVAIAQDRSTILVVDGSGSMWAQLPEGRSRIEVARDVLGDFLSARDPSLPLGVIAYGYNRKGDCNDIETLAPVGLQDGRALGQRLRALMPRGKTPLADALRRAASEIPATAEEADIVLVTDGLETCGGDPCAVAAELAAEGIQIRAHVVGFGLTEGEVRQIACIADQTGGLLLAPQSGAELSDALMRTASADPVPPPAVATPVQAILTAPERVRSRAKITVTWELPDNLAPASEPADRLWWATEARPDDSNRAVADVDPSSGTAEIQAPAEAGTWFLVYNRWFEGSSGYRAIARAKVVVEGAEYSVTGPGAVQAGSRLNVKWSGPIQAEDRLTLAQPGDNRFSNLPSAYDFEQSDTYEASGEYSGVSELIAPVDPGPFEIKLLIKGPEGVQIAALDALKVIPPRIEIVAPGKVVAGQEFKIEYRGPVGGDSWIDMTAPNETAVRGNGYHFGSWEYLKNMAPTVDDFRQGTFRAPEEPGRYDIRVVLSTNDRRPVFWKPLEVVADGPLVNELGFEMNSDRPGSDIASTRLPSPDPEMCHNICLNTEGCKAWTFVQPGIQSDAAMCWTKSAVPSARKSDCCISGVIADIEKKRTSLDSSGRDFAAAQVGTVPDLDEAASPTEDAAPAQPAKNEAGYELNIDRPGMDLDSIPLATPDPAMCEALCADTPDCKAWTFVRPGVQQDSAVCWTKSGIPPAAENDCCISGTVSEPDRASLDMGDGVPSSGDGLGEDVGYVCDGPAPCPINDAETGLSFMLPAGWWTDYPSTNPYTAGALAAGEKVPPHVNFFRKGTDDTLVLGPRQWVDMNGPCEDVGALGQFCMFQSDDPQVLAAYQLVKATLKWEQSQAAVQMQGGQPDFVAGVMQGVAGEDAQTQAIIGALLGAAQNAGPNGEIDQQAVMGTLLGAMQGSASDAALSNGIVQTRPPRALTPDEMKALMNLIEEN